MNKTHKFMDMNMREKISLDEEWQFHLASASDPDPSFGFIKAGKAFRQWDNVNFASTTWRKVDLPHDWVVELGFEPDADLRHGFKAMDTAQSGENAIGWYRKSIHIPAEDNGKRISVLFDGIFRDSVVWINGHYIGRHTSGYTSFIYDITDYIRFGAPNVIVVRVDARNYEGWWYEGGGIYRHVWLLKTAPVHMAHWGTYVSHEIGNENTVTVIKTRLEYEENNTQNDECTIKMLTTILDNDGNVTAKDALQDVTIGNHSSVETVTKLIIDDPRMWSIDDPYLYKAVTEVVLGDTIVDRYETSFGIRSLRFDPEAGFFLNGQNVKIKGVCCHQDHAGVGVAVPDRLQYYRIEKLKEMGCNAYRTSHNPPSPEILEACDRLGMLVMDEQRYFDSGPEGLSQLESMILRDRNHPCIILWSIGNEELVQGTKTAENIANAMIRCIKKLDPSRPVTYAGNNGATYMGVNPAVEVRGWNYYRIGNNMDEYHKDHPHQPIVGSEEASTLCTRGIYENDLTKGYVDAYGRNLPPWGAAPWEWWKYYMDRPYLAGGFVWTGFDYRGEPTPFGWPCINSHLGIMDMCGFPKDIYYYYQAWWKDEPALHIFPHWNWKGKEGREITVMCFSNCSEVELFLNGTSLGRKEMERYGHLLWPVVYQPGTLAAAGYMNGKQVLTQVIRTTGHCRTIRMVSDRIWLNADNRDIAVITVSAVDQEGLLVPDADHEIIFTAEGCGRIIGVGNGDPSSHEPDRYIETFVRKPASGWKAKNMKDILQDRNYDWDEKKDLDNENIYGNLLTDRNFSRLTDHLHEIAAGYDDSGWRPLSETKLDGDSYMIPERWEVKQTEESNGEKGSLGKFGWRKLWMGGEGYSGDILILRTVIHMDEQELEQGWNRLIVNKTGGHAVIYFNGTRAGEIINCTVEHIFDISGYLKKGDNSLAVVLKKDLTFNIAGEISLAAVKLPVWKRKLFNGSCSLIVQSGKQPGKITVTATSTGLKGTVLSIDTVVAEIK